MRRVYALSLLALLTVCAPLGVYASGLEFPAYGTVGTGRASAFTARADDLTAIYYNPAGLVHSRGPLTVLYNHSASRLDMSYERRAWDHAAESWHDFGAAGSPNPVSNGAGWFLKGGFMALASDLGTERFSLAAGVYGPSSIGQVSYPEDGAQRYQLVERDVLMLFYTLSGAWRFSDNFSLGVSLQWVDMPYSRYTLMIDGYNDNHYRPFGSDQDLLSTLDVADRFTFSAILGAWWRPWPFLEVGLAGRVIPINVEAEGTMSLEPVGDMVQPEQAGLENWALLDCEPGQAAADCRETNAARLGLTIPPNLRLGVRYVHRRGARECFDLELDATYEFWSMLNKFDVSTDASHVLLELRGGSIAHRPIAGMSVPKNYRDAFGLRVGGDLHVMPQWLTLRAGGLFETGAADPAYANVDFAPFQRFGVSTGLTSRWRGVALSFAYMHIFQADVTVSESDAKLLQHRPSELCSSDETFCDGDYGGATAPAANSGVFKSGYDILSVGLSVDWDGW